MDSAAVDTEQCAVVVKPHNGGIWWSVSAIYPASAELCRKGLALADYAFRTHATNRGCLGRSIAGDATDLAWIKILRKSFQEAATVGWSFIDIWHRGRRTCNLDLEQEIRNRSTDSL